MQREIEFRVWDTERNQFVGDCEITFAHYGDTKITVSPNSIDYIHDSCHNGGPQRGRFIVQQFTGLKDKSGEGNEVFEGDIFEVVFSDTPNGYRRLGRESTYIFIKAVVVFKFGQFAVEFMHPELKKIVYTNLSIFLKNDEKIVLGNIYENSEMIEK